MDADYLKPVYRWLHILWAITGSAASVLLASAKGHPPGLVFVPVVIAIWLGGHALLWLSRKLAVKGKFTANNRNVGESKWPVLLILLGFLFGAAFIFGAFGLAWQAFSGARWGIELLSVAAIWLTASLCFFGILLRQDWSRILAGSGFIVLAAIMLYEMIASFMRGYKNSPAEWVAVIILFILLVSLGQYILRSTRIKVFFAR
jgi:hypothetical protein